MSDFDTYEEEPYVQDIEESPTSEKPQYVSRKLALTLIAVVGLLFIFAVASSCDRPVVKTGEIPPTLSFEAAVLTDEERQRVAEEYIQAVGTYGWDTPITTWTREVEKFTKGASNTSVFPLTGPAFARCLNDKCQYLVTQISRIDGTDMTFRVVNSLTTSSSSEVFDRVWQVSVNTEGVVTSSSSFGEG